MTSSNTISQLAKNEVSDLSNSIEILNSFTKALLTSDESYISINLLNSNNEPISLKLPNIYLLERKIEDIQNNVNQLSGLENTAYITMPDGSVKRIIASSTSKSPKPLTNLAVPTSFERKNNWFFENFITPLLYIDFDLTNQLETGVDSVLVKRLILDLDSSSKRTFFETNLKNRNDLNYNETLNLLTSNAITYNIDDEEYKIEPTYLRYEGTFGVNKIFDSLDTTTNTKIRYYNLSNIYYKDNLTTSNTNIALKVGDVLTVGDSTKFQILTIDISSKNVTLKRINGTASIKTGDNIFALESQVFTNKKIAVNVGYDEQQIIFITTINRALNIRSTEYSPGICFNSNDLTITSGTGEVSLSEYYKNEVVDFGKHIYNLSKDRTIPTIFGILPDPPALQESYFKVVKINDQLDQDQFTKNVATKISARTTVKNDIKKISDEIVVLTKERESFPIGSPNRNQVDVRMDALVANKTKKISEYNSLVNELSLIYNTTSVENIKPKYRIRGMFPYPTPKVDVRTGTQEVIKFVIYYRYLTTNNNSPSAKTFTYKDDNGNNIEGVFSNWNTIETPTRKRILDDATGKFKWVIDDVANAEEVNVNQLDIPITAGENVEIKIVSVSEAGYPTSPLYSGFSNSIIITFPAELNDQIDLYSALEEISREQERAIILDELRNYDLDKHLRTSENIESENRYYAHSATQVNSNIPDANGKTLSVFEIITRMQTQIKELENKINNQTPIELKNGNLKVYVEGVDRNGKITRYDVRNGSIVELQPPSYYNRVSSLSFTQRRGAIIKENYTLVLENTGSGVLKLNTKYPGATYDKLPVLDGSNLTWKGTSFQDDDYKFNKMYYKVPVRYSNFKTYNDIKDVKDRFGYGMQQASQVAGQFIYCRYKDITGARQLFNYSQFNTAGYLPTPPGLPGTKKSFIWNGTWNQAPSGIASGNNFTPSGNGLLLGFSVHIEHDDVKNKKKSYSDLLNNDIFKENYLEHSGYMNIEKGKTNFNIQSELSTNPVSNKFHKMGFYENDRYLIGENTTGMYFYMNPNKPDDVRVNGNDQKSVREIEAGGRITIPLVIEYRMTDYYDENDTFAYNKALNNSVALTSADLSLNLTTTQSTVSNTYNNTKSVAVSSQYIGVVGGYSSSNINRKDFNISYEKELGFDIYIQNGETFSFDLRANTVYGSTINSILLDTTTSQNGSDRVTNDRVGTLTVDNLIVRSIDNNIIL